MKVDGTKVLLTREEYRTLRNHLSGWEWNEYARFRPANLDLYEWDGNPIVACIEKVNLYVERQADVDQTVEVIKNLTMRPGAIRG